MKLLLLFYSMFFVALANACSCIGEATVKEEAKRSDLIVVGKIISREVFVVASDLSPSNGFHQARYQVQVTKKYQGKLSANTLAVVTGVGGGDCGSQFEIGSEYIIYCTKQNRAFPSGDEVAPFFQTDICRRNRKAADAAELKELKKTTKRLRWWWWLARLF